VTTLERRIPVREKRMPSAKVKKLLGWYGQMVLIREFEDACDRLFWEEKQITGVYLHLYSGHEAVGVGALAALTERDHVITAYRDHGIALARGLDVGACMAEMMGRVDGTSGGKGGSMHLADRSRNFWGGYAIVGGHLPLAVGIALASQYRGEDEVTLCFVGDGATNNGYFHESLNMAAIWDLPMVWLIENNFVAMGTRVEKHAGEPELHKRAAAYGMKSLGRVDGQDVQAVHDITRQAVKYARNKGPVLLEALTYRYKGHGVSDRSYDQRFAAELAEYRESKDPIELLKRKLLQAGHADETSLGEIEAVQQEKVKEAVAFAAASPAPSEEHLYQNVYVETERA